MNDVDVLVENQGNYAWTMQIAKTFAFRHRISWCAVEADPSPFHLHIHSTSCHRLSTMKDTLRPWTMRWYWRLVRMDDSLRDEIKCYLHVTPKTKPMPL